MKTERTEMDPPAPTPCAACPWLTRNHGKPQAKGYYSDANRRRLWGGLRTGDAPGMTCHPTDPENQPVKDDVRTRECTGAWMLLMREVRAVEAAETLAAYRKGRKLALTRGGLLSLLNALIMPKQFGGRGLNGTELDADAAGDVSLGLGTGR